MSSTNASDSDESESMFAHPHISVALFSSLAAYSLILLSLLIFALSTERLAWWRVRRLYLKTAPNKRMDPLTRSWFIPQFGLLCYRFILSLLSMTFWIACLINAEDYDYLRWYSFWNYTVLMLYFLLSFMLTNIDLCDPEFMDSGTKIEKVRRLVWILHAVMTVNGIASSIGVWIFVYNDADKTERYELTQIRSIGTNIANVGFIVFELFCNCIPLVKWEVIWCLVFAEVYVFSSIFSDYNEADEDGVTIDWFFYHAESKTLLRFFVFTFLHIVVFGIVWLASNIKFKGVIENLWQELNHYDHKALENPQYGERRVSHSQKSARSSLKKGRKRRSPLPDQGDQDEQVRAKAQRPLESFFEQHMQNAEDLYQRHSTWGEASHASASYSESAPGNAPSFSRQSSWDRLAQAAKRSISQMSARKLSRRIEGRQRAEGEELGRSPEEADRLELSDPDVEPLQIVVDQESGKAAMIRKKPSPRPPDPRLPAAKPLRHPDQRSRSWVRSPPKRRALSLESPKRKHYGSPSWGNAKQPAPRGNDADGRPKPKKKNRLEIPAMD